MENTPPNERRLENTISHGITGNFLNKKNALSLRAVSKFFSNNRGSRRLLAGREQNERTLVMSKAEFGHNKNMNINILLAKEEHPQKLEVRDRNGYTALLLAAAKNHTVAALKLIRAGANVRAETIFKETALSFAINFQNTLLVKELLQAGANTYDLRSTRTKRTPFEEAIIQNNSEFVYLLLEAGAVANRPNIISLALYPQKKIILELLVRKGADINAIVKLYYTPLIIAITERTSDIVEIMKLVDILIELGANINGTDNNTNPLTIAFRHRFNTTVFSTTPETLPYLIFVELLKRSANPNLRSENGLPLLSECIQTLDNPYEISEYHKKYFDRLLIHPTINVNLQDTKGQTPLHWAVDKSSVYCVEKLITKGADPTIKKYTNTIFNNGEGNSVIGYDGDIPLQNGQNAYEMCIEKMATMSNPTELAKLQTIMTIFDRPRNPNAGSPSSASRYRVRKTRKNRKSRKNRVSRERKK